jgi:hypothetical protein
MNLVSVCRYILKYFTRPVGPDSSGSCRREEARSIVEVALASTLQSR